LKKISGPCWRFLIWRGNRAPICLSTYDGLPGPRSVFFRNTPYLPRFIYQEMHRCPLPGHLALGSQVASGVHDHLNGMIRSAVKAGQIDPIEPAQLIANIMALCIHPFLAKPMICMAYGMDEEAFQRFLEKRKRGVADFVIRALRPDPSDKSREPRRRSSPKKQ
jgi:hypothetical protein